MSIFATAVSGNGERRNGETSKGRGPLIGELYDLARGNLQLLMIYKKIEIAAETGDWPLMNELYGEFKITHAAMN